MSKPRFEFLTPTQFELNNFQTRIEKHGDANVLAVDLAVTLTTHNSILQLLHPELCAGIFTNLTAEQLARQDAEAGQTKMDLPVSELPNIRFDRLLYPLKWDLELTGYIVKVEQGINDDSAIVLNMCVLKKFNVTPIEGGSVEIKFTISSSADIGEDVTAKMPAKQQTKIAMTLTAPALVEGGAIDASQDGDAPGSETPEVKPAGKGRKPPKDATEAFVEASGGALTH